jgi:hypothetical protein
VIQSDMPDYIYVCKSKPKNKGKGLLKRIINNRNFAISVRRFDFPGAPNTDVDASVYMLDEDNRWIELPTNVEDPPFVFKITFKAQQDGED